VGENNSLTAAGMHGVDYKSIEVDIIRRSELDELTLCGSPCSRACSPRVAARWPDVR